MTYEEAYYYKILLTCGITDGYDGWLRSYLEREEPLSDIVLELSFCGSDTDRAIACLKDHCLGQPLDDKKVCDMLRGYLLSAYSEKRLSKDEVVKTMYRFALDHCGSVNDHNGVWADMYCMEDYRLLAEEGVITKDSFDTAFHEYLRYGTPVSGEALFVKKEGFGARVKKIFKKQKNFLFH